MFRRLSFLLPLLLLCVLLVPSQPAFARFNSLPDLFGLSTSSPTGASWPVNAFATCNTVTVELSYPADQNPVGIPDPYTSVTWSLERVLVNGTQPVEVNETDKTIYTFPYNTPGGQKHSKTFTLKTPLEAGTGLFLEVRYQVNGGELGGGSEVFDVGDFDHPYWHMRAYNPSHSVSNIQQFCGDNSTAPTLYVLGEVVQKEGSSGTQTYQPTLFLSKPTNKPVRIDIESRQAAGLPAYEPERPTFNGYDSRGIAFGSAVCAASPDPGCIVPNYTTLIIPPGQTQVTLPVTLYGNTEPSVNFFEPYTFQVIRVANAKLGGNLSQPVRLISRNDDGCYEEREPGSCYINVFSPYDIPPLRIDKYSFVVSNKTVNENAGSVTFDVTLTNPVDGEVILEYATTSEGYNATAGGDYTAKSGTISFAANTIGPKQIVVPIINNPELEDLEAFGLRVWNPYSANEDTSRIPNEVTVGALIYDQVVAPTPTPTSVPATATSTPVPTEEVIVTDVIPSTETPEPTSTAVPEEGITQTATSDTMPTEEATPAATAEVTPTPEGVELLLNGDFELKNANGKPELSPWTLKHASRDKIRCNKDTRVVANTGDCAFMLRGVAGEKTRLIQKAALDTFAFEENDKLVFTAHVNAKDSARGSIKIRVEYADDALETGKIDLDLRQTDQYEVFTGEVTLRSGDVDSIRVTIIHRTPSGKVFIDTVSLKQKDASTLLPLP